MHSIHGRALKRNSIPSPEEENLRRAAASTVEALMFGLRDGIEAFPANPDTLRQLSELSEEQLRAVCERLQNFKFHIAPAWSAEEVRALVDIWSASRG
jgi:hypothetical protein